MDKCSSLYIFKEKQGHVLLEHLMTTSDYQSVNGLHISTGIPIRKLRNYLDDLDSFILDFEVKPLEKIPGKGIRIPDATKKTLSFYLSTLQDDSTDFNLYFYKQLHRKLFIVFALLNKSQPITLELLANTFGVSTRTVQNDLSTIKSDLKSMGLYLLSTKSLGYELVGSSIISRGYLLGLFKELIQTSKECDFYQVLSDLFKTMDAECPFTGEQYQQLRARIKEILINYYNDALLDIVVQNIALSVVSTTCTHQNEFSASEVENITRNVNYDIAKLIRLESSKILSMDIPEDNDFHIATILQTIPFTPANNDVDNYPFEFDVITQKLIGSVGELYQYDFTADRELYEFLVHHVGALMYRIIYSDQTNNAVVKEAIEKYSDLHAMVKTSLLDIEQVLQKPISEDEAAYITIYFASSLEKLSRPAGGSKNVVIVCNSGIAFGRLLQYRLENRFNVHVVATLSDTNLFQFILENQQNNYVDAIVSIIDLGISNLNGIPVITISSSFTEQDVNKLRKVFGSNNRPSEDVSCVMSQSELVRMLSATRFKLYDSVNDLDDLILQSANLLQADGLCDETYGEQMVKVAHRFGPLTTIIVAPFFIMPHAEISEHVFGTGFSFIRLEKPVQANNTDIYFSMALCTRGKDISAQAVRELGVLLYNQQFTSEIWKVKSYQELTSLINSCLHTSDRRTQ